MLANNVMLSDIMLQEHCNIVCSINYYLFILSNYFFTQQPPFKTQELRGGHPYSQKSYPITSWPR
jgi:hypothetical protein